MNRQNELKHYGIPGMHWYEHLDSAKQMPAHKYALGDRTKGFVRNPIKGIDVKGKVKTVLSTILHLNPNIGRMLDSSVGVYGFAKDVGRQVEKVNRLVKENSGNETLHKIAKQKAASRPTNNPAINLMYNAYTGARNTITNYVNSPNGRKKVDTAKASTFKWFLNTAQGSRSSKPTSTSITRGRPNRL